MFEIIEGMSGFGAVPANPGLWTRFKRDFDNLVRNRKAALDRINTLLRAAYAAKDQARVNQLRNSFATQAAAYKTRIDAVALKLKQAGHPQVIPAPPAMYTATITTDPTPTPNQTDPTPTPSPSGPPEDRGFIDALGSLKVGSVEIPWLLVLIAGGGYVWLTSDNKRRR